jgi:hypothetical protein
MRMENKSTQTDSHNESDTQRSPDETGSMHRTSGFAKDVAGHQRELQLELRVEEQEEQIQALMRKVQQLEEGKELTNSPVAMEPETSKTVFFHSSKRNKMLSGDTYVDNEIKEVENDEKMYQPTDTTHFKVRDINLRDMEKMTNRDFYEELEKENQATITELYNTHPAADIMLKKDKNGFAVEPPEKSWAADLVKIKDAQNRIQDDINAYINDNLGDFHGESIAYIVEKAKTEHLDALTNLTVYYLTASRKKALKISSSDDKKLADDDKKLADDDKKLADLWHKVRDIYGRAKEGNDGEDAIAVMRYIERYSDVKSLTSKKKDFQQRARRLTAQAYRVLSYLKPSHRARILKQQMTRIVGEEEARLAKIVEQEKERRERKRAVSKSETEGNEKSETEGNEEQNQEIKLKGSRGREQRQLKQIIALRAEYQNTINSLKLEKVKGTLSRERIIDVMNEFFNKCSEYPLFQSGLGRTRLENARNALSLHLQKNTGTEVLNANYNIGVLDANMHKQLEKVQKELKETIKKYGAKPWRTLLNDISSDGSALFTVISTGLLIGGVSI